MGHPGMNLVERAAYELGFKNIQLVRQEELTCKFWSTSNSSLAATPD